MEQNFNKLTPAETERLSLLAEECGEVIQAIGKILRHGFESNSPLLPDSPNNRHQLARECGHVIVSITRMVDAHDLRSADVVISKMEKRRDVQKYLHHQV
jgi:NTP pyrophosphatase (non-canonical NTP hydrolase)